LTNLRIALLVVILAFTVWGLLQVDKAMKSHFNTRLQQIEAIK
jgi:hypothetical protein